MSFLHFATGKESGRRVHAYHAVVAREAGVTFGGGQG